ncbi:MAG: ABC transporter permease, partial [Vicinamibacteria bacterium]|nr:ABC transporter permease [Vicinamibacteria bacterium]
MEVVESAFQDVRAAVRMLGRRPIFTLAVVSVMSLAIGANTAVFSVMRAVLLRPLPYENPSRLVVVWERVTRLGLDRNLVSPSNYSDWKRRSRVFKSMGAYTELFLILTGDGGEAERVPGISATPSLFMTLG